jgi:hypothetical protein
VWIIWSSEVVQVVAKMEVAAVVLEGSALELGYQLLAALNTQSQLAVVVLVLQRL